MAEIHYDDGNIIKLDNRDEYAILLFSKGPNAFLDRFHEDIKKSVRPIYESFIKESNKLELVLREGDEFPCSLVKKIKFEWNSAYVWLRDGRIIAVDCSLNGQTRWPFEGEFYQFVKKNGMNNIWDRVKAQL